MPISEYVNILSGHPCDSITSIGDGVEGNNLLIDNVLEPLVPQPFDAITEMVPPVYPTGYVKEIFAVPCPVKPMAPAGTVQV